MERGFIERRRSPRIPMGGGAQVVRPVSMAVRLLDVSSEGVLMACPSPMTPGVASRVIARLGNRPLDAGLDVRHVSAEWERGQPDQVGSIMRAVEDLDGSREALRFQVTRLEPGRGLTYRFRGPISMLLPGGSFVVAPDNGGSSFTATLWYRFGPLTRLVFHRRVAVLRQHVREEALNLKRNIEAGHGVPDPRPCADPSIGRWRRR